MIFTLASVKIPVLQPKLVDNFFVNRFELSKHRLSQLKPKIKSKINSDKLDYGE
jgi:hypothetical protein